MIQKGLSNIDVVLYALNTLGGNNEKILTEDIALKCFSLAPSRFSWILYPQYPDLEPVRKALFRARSKNLGGLVIGRHGKTKENQISDGWMMTPRGIEWFKKNTEKIELLLNKKEKNVRRTKVDQKIFGLKKSVAFKKFLRDGDSRDIEDFEFTDFLDANLDTPALILRDRVARILSLAASVKDEGLANFMNNAEKRFHNLLKR